MAPERVTLHASTYEIRLLVMYPRMQRVDELMQECTMQSKEALNPGSKLCYFMCIHYGIDDYSNKLMLTGIGKELLANTTVVVDLFKEWRREMG